VKDAPVHNSMLSFPPGKATTGSKFSSQWWSHQIISN